MKRLRLVRDGTISKPEGVEIDFRTSDYETWLTIKADDDSSGELFAAALEAAFGEASDPLDWHGGEVPSYPATPVDCLISELREMFGFSGERLPSLGEFEDRVAQFKNEIEDSGS